MLIAPFEIAEVKQVVASLEKADSQALKQQFYDRGLVWA